MRLPIAFLENKKIQRIIFTIQPSSQGTQQLYELMEKVYATGGWCLHLPTSKHLKLFKALRENTGNKRLVGFGQIDADLGVTLTGKPLCRFESQVISTMIRTTVPPHLARKLFPVSPAEEVLTQKEIDRMTFDRSRFDQILSSFHPEETPFLIIGGKYGDWLWGLSRGDLLKEMFMEARQKGFIPIFAGLWATFVLPKAKHLDASAYAVPINQRRGLFHLPEACELIKKFDRPIISLDPLAERELFRESEQAFSFLFHQLKIDAAIVEVTSEKEIVPLFQAVKHIPSLIPFRKT